MLSWLTAKLSSKYLPYIAIIAVIVGWTYASYSWGYSAKAAKVAVDRADGLERTLSETETRLKAANALEAKGLDREEEIRNVRTRAVIEIDPAGCAPDDATRMRINARSAARFGRDDSASAMPGGMPETAPDG